MNSESVIICVGFGVLILAIIVLGIVMFVVPGNPGKWVPPLPPKKKKKEII